MKDQRKHREYLSYMANRRATSGVMVGRYAPFWPLAADIRILFTVSCRLSQ